MIDLINGSWEQTQVYLLNEILKGIGNQPDINVSVNPPEVKVKVYPPKINVNPPQVHINLDEVLRGIEHLSNKIDDVKPVIVIDKIQFNNHLEVENDVIKKRAAQIIVNKKPILEVDTTKWLIVNPGNVKRGYVEALWYNFGEYKVLSNKLFWFVKDDLRRTLLIANPINPTKEYYLEAFEEARAFGLDLSNYYQNKIKNL